VDAVTSPVYPNSPAGLDPLAQATHAANALMERTPFAIDDAGDDDEDEDDEEESEQDDVLDEVRFVCERPGDFVQLLNTVCRWMPSSRRTTRASRMRTGRSRKVSKCVHFTILFVHSSNFRPTCSRAPVRR
jgi:hypothetical protein